jgi:hypothetical protein
MPRPENAGEAGNRLGHEFHVIVKIVVVKINVYESRNALRAPINALFRKRDQWSVYTVERSRASSVSVIHSRK